MRIAGVLVVALVVGCAHAPQSPISLEQSLRLDVEATQPASQIKVRVRSLLRNVSPVAVDLCQLDSGVTIAAIVGEQVVPLSGSGAVTDASCYRAGTLVPGGARVFEDEVSLWPGTTAIRSTIRVHRPGQNSSEIRSLPVPVPTSAG
jgi:hypothetical protein